MTFPMAVLLASQMAANQLPPVQPVQAADSAHSEAVTLATPMGQVYGTLLVPSASGAVPVVLIIAGSGPTDRDGNSPLLPGGGPASLKLLAQALADHGIASLRYDKRGIGASTMPPDKLKDLRFNDYVDDAAAWVTRLRADPRFSRVVIAGHSEGALIGTLAAQRSPNVALVSIDGAGRRASDVLHEQLAKMPPPLPAQADSIMAELNAGRTVASVPLQLMAVFNPGVQPYEISWFKYDPAAEIAKLSAPVLIIQGGNDVQVSADDAHRLANSAGANGKLVVVDSMTHVLKLAGPDMESQKRTYTDPSLPIAPALVDAVVAFVRTPGTAAGGAAR